MALCTTSLLISTAAVILLLPSEAEGHFLSVEDLEEFYDLEEKLVTTFSTYIDEQKQILEVAKQRYEEQKRWQPVINDTDKYLENPLNVHALLKRLVSDWPLTLALLGGSFGDDDDDDDEKEEPIKLPNKEEYRASVRSIARLHQVYNFSIPELVSGSVFPGTDKTSILTAEDCLAVAKDFYERRHYLLAVDWLKEALALASNQSKGGEMVKTRDAGDQSTLTPPIDNVYEYLALASCFTGNQRQSKKYFNKLYTKFPEFRPTQSLIKDHLLAVNDSCRKLIDNESLKPKDHNANLNLSWREDAELSEEYARLCRAVTVPTHSTQLLKCYLADYYTPYWFLQPFKMEALHMDPDIYLTYNVISPAERQFIMDNMIDEKIMHMNGFVYEFWKQLPKNSSVSEAIVRRVEAISEGKVHNTREQVMLSSCPVGAEYVVDQDIDFKMENPGEFRAGATFFFLEQPIAGGLIVFPRFNLSVAPVAGTALTWYNVDSEDKGDPRVIYGMCPIIQGHLTGLSMWFKDE